MSRSRRCAAVPQLHQRHAMKQRKITLSRWMIVPMACCFALAGVFSPDAASADETVGEKAQTTADKTETQANQSVRKSKKKARDASGKKDVGKDIGDSAKSAGESVQDTAKETERKVD